MISIHIDLHPEQGPLDRQLADAMLALGYTRLLDSTSLTPVGTAAVEAALTETSDEPAVKPQAATARVPGQPAPGKQRRTKAEIAEDEARVAAAADEKPAISTGEPRIGPEDSPEDVEQDAADEAAETAAAAPADEAKTLTLDDVRHALGEYAAKFGMDATQQDGPQLLKLVCGDAVDRMSLIPDDQAVLGKVVAGIREMLEKNPYQREPIKAVA